MVIEYLGHIISNTVFIITTIIIINVLDISKIESIKRMVISVIAITIFSAVTFISYLYDLDPLPLLLYPLSFVTAYIIAFKKISKGQIYIAMIAETTTSLFALGISSILCEFLNCEKDTADFLSLLCIRIILLMAAVLLYRSPKENLRFVYTISQTIPKHIFVLILISNVIMLGLVAVNNHPNNSNLKQITVTILITLLSILLLIVVLSLIINVAAQRYYLKLNQILEKQVSMQIAHYEKLEKLSSDMRTFRHDYINHLSSISALITEGFYDDAQGYIDRLTESTHRNETIFRTGNRLADAILTDKNENCKAFADIVFDGCITDKIGNSDICIILANALDNAAEACKSCPERGRISIESQVRQGYLKMVMRNPTVGADSEGIMKTSKEDERNHGFGLLSIEQAVKRYDGTMSVSIKNGVFELAVVLKLPMEKPQ